MGRRALWGSGFYNNKLTETVYANWLSENAVQYVALPGRAAGLVVDRRSETDQEQTALPRTCIA